MIGVVLVRRGDNPELRYAMRSWSRNVAQISDVIAVGMPPRWVNTRQVLTPQSSTKYANTTYALRYVCAEKLLPERFVLLNDDFYALRPTRVPTWHRGPMLDVVADYRQRGIDSAYVRGMEATAHALIRAGIETPLCYEVHAPMVIERDLMVEILDRYMADESVRVLHKRSAYGNHAGIGGVEVEDVKLRLPSEAQDSAGDGPVWDGNLPHMDWISTSDAVWADGAGLLIQDRFPAMCRWERNPNVAAKATSPGKIRRTV